MTCSLWTGGQEDEQVCRQHPPPPPPPLPHCNHSSIIVQCCTVLTELYGGPSLHDYTAPAVRQLAAGYGAPRGIDSHPVASENISRLGKDQSSVCRLSSDLPGRAAPGQFWYACSLIELKICSAFFYGRKEERNLISLQCAFKVDFLVHLKECLLPFMHWIFEISGSWMCKKKKKEEAFLLVIICF